MNEDRQTNSFIKTLDSLAIHQANAIKKMPEFFGAIEPSENFYLYKMDNLIQGIPFLTIK
jgi:hypothetical protein